MIRGHKPRLFLPSFDSINSAALLQPRQSAIFLPSRLLKMSVISCSLQHDGSPRAGPDTEPGKSEGSGARNWTKRFAFDPSRRGASPSFAKTSRLNVLQVRDGLWFVLRAGKRGAFKTWKVPHFFPGAAAQLTRGRHRNVVSKNGSI